MLSPSSTTECSKAKLLLLDINLEAGASGERARADQLLQSDVFGLRRSGEIDLENSRRQAVRGALEANGKNVGNA